MQNSTIKKLNLNMSPAYWLKLWVEIMDDPKIAKMPDWLFRRFILLLCAAKEYDHDGLLQPVQDLAWRLRLDAELVTQALLALSEIGVVRNSSDGWLIVNFAKRQAVSESAVRMRKLREKQKVLQSDAHSDASLSSALLCSSSDSSSDSFTEMQHLVEEVTGNLIKPGKEDFDALNELVRMNATREDIEAAVAFFKSKGKVARGASQILKSVGYAIAQRVQSSVPSPEDKEAKLLDVYPRFSAGDPLT